MANIGVNDLKQTELNIDKAKQYAGKYAKEILRHLFQQLEITKHFAVDYDVKFAKRYPKIVTKTGIRPYDGKIDADASNIELSDRDLQVSVGQTEMVIDPEKFRNTWATEETDISKGKVALEVYILEDFLASILEAINNDIFFFADKSSTDKHLKIIDGLEKKIEALITAGDTAPIITPAFTETVGVFGNITAVGTTIPNIKKIWKSFTIPQRKKTIYIDVSYDIYEMYVNSYRKEFGHECSYSKTAVEGDQLVIDGTGGKAILRRASWLGDSQRVIAHILGAVRLGTDIDQFVGSIDIQKLGYLWVYMVKVVLGLEVIDPEAFRCNNLT